MPIKVPAIDERRYADLLAEAIARIPVHNPEWTNFNRSDPGITIIELFAFLTESMLYRANRIPERNRRKFLSLLGLPLRPAACARGVVTVDYRQGPLATRTFDAGLEVLAGQVPFRTELGLDVLPVEGRLYAKRPVELTDELRTAYRRLYASFLLADDTRGGPPARLQPYETVLIDGTDPRGVDLAADTADGALWLALLARRTETAGLDEIREELAGRTLNLGVVPVVTEADVVLPPAGTGNTAGTAHLRYAFPVVPPGGVLPADPRQRVARYAAVTARAEVNVLLEPSVVQIALPGAAGLATWTGLDPLEEGVNGFPPALDDPALAARLVTWLRIGATSAGQGRLLWAGINATTVSQRSRVRDEVLPDGTGLPDQTVQLAKAPVIPGSVRLTVVTGQAGAPPRAEVWQETDDLLAAGAEVPVPDLRLPPGAPQPPAAPDKVYTLDAEAGVIRFGDGLRGRRPPAGAELRADYDHGVGRAGNVGPRTITGAPALPPGYAVTNPVRTWGGADAETVAEGERQVARHLQHRDRLVTAADFDTIARRAPGVDLARVDVLPAYDPRLSPDVPGNAPGAVTLLIVPRHDLAQPDAPSPDRYTLNAVCRYLDERRLVTTELLLRGPEYVPIWISVGVDVTAGQSVAVVQARVAAELRRVLSPLPLAHQPGAAGPPAASFTGAPDAYAPPAAPYAHAGGGWPLRTPVSAAELTAFATRVDGVRLVRSLLLAAGGDAATDSVEMTGLRLPRVAGIAVTPGDPLPLEQLRGAAPPEGPVPVVPVPVVPEGC
ncbi:baseplate J/gp47 family protein [Thermopolyspora sp. NPDC052614]|uniref:baseplate J/gp47 family protein n=1 Tax=Thermopolyspora sp. NPDC052614 TaxID=3155682 RepID=UPI00342C003C